MLDNRMAHLSLYRKYRPQSFAEIVGQLHVTQTLRSAIAQNRVAHAFLFSGPRGTGKTSSARILAKALNCVEGGEEPCNRCPSCLQITEGSSLDVVEIDAASHGSVDDARDLREKVAYASTGGRWKVYIIDECHMLSPAANNALLKLLEEPPPHVIFVFATTEPHKVLQTLLDRCQRYEFRAVSGPDIADRVAQVAEAEGMSVEQAALGLIAARSGGSVRDGLSLLEQLRSFGGNNVTADSVAELLGHLPEELMFEAVDLISERDAGAILGFADRLIRSGVDVRLFAHSLVNHLRSIFLILYASAAEEILEVPDERMERLRSQANRLDGAEVLRLLDLANETQLQLRQGIDGRLALEVALTRMTRPELHAAPSSMLQRIERLEGAPRPAAGVADLRQAVQELKDAPKAKLAPPRPRVTAPSDRPAAEATPPATTAVQPVVEAPRQDGPVDTDKVLRAWPLIMDKVKRRKISFQALLHAAKPVAYKNGELILEFSPRSRFHKEEVSNVARQQPLVEAFVEIFGERPRIRCVLGEEEQTPAEPPKPQAPDDLDDAVRESSRDAPDQTLSTKGQDPAREAIELIREAFSGTEVVDGQ